MPRRNRGPRSGNGTGAMARIDIDPRTAERLLAGRVGGDDLTPGAAGVGRVLDAARQAATESDLSAMDATVAAMAEVVAGQQVPVLVYAPAAPAARRSGPRAWVPRLLTVSVAGLTAVFGALAVAGALPPDAQRPVADIASRVGIDLPRPDETPKSSDNPAATTTTSPSTTTVPPGETTETTAVTTETTVAGPPCSPPAYLGESGCVSPESQPAVIVPPTTTTTKAPPPPPPTSTSTTVQSGGTNQEQTSGGAHSHSDGADPGVS
jgi:hypothetical protein